MRSSYDIQVSPIISEQLWAHRNASISNLKMQIPHDFVSKIVVLSFLARQKCQIEYGAFKASSWHGVDSSFFDTKYVTKQGQREQF